MADLILVNAPRRTLRELYGDPPGGLSPTCTPKRGEQTVEDWYAEQEERHGLYAALKAKRPKRGWFSGRSEEPEEPEEQEVPAYQPQQLPKRQQRYTVQEQLRQQRQAAGNSGVSETEISDGIYWFTIGENEEARR